MLLSHCDLTKPPYLPSGELCTSPLHSNRLYVYTVCCRRGGQCFSVLRTRHTDVLGDSSGRSYVTEQGHNVPVLHTRDYNKYDGETERYLPRQHGSRHVDQVAQTVRCLSMCWMAQVRSWVLEGWRFFFIPLCPDWSWGPLSLL